MGSSPSTTSSRVEVEVSSDLMVASIAVRKKPSRSAPLTAEETLEALRDAEIVMDDDVQARVAEFVELVNKRGPLDEPFAVVDCRPALADRSERLVWDSRFESEASAWQEDAAVNYYTFNSIIVVDKDTVIGRIEKPAVPCDVRGAPVSAGRATVPLEIDDTVGRSPDDPQKLVARISGKVVEEHHRIRIDEVLRVRGDVDFESGNIDSPIEVHIDGRVPDGFEVRSARSVTVGMSVEAAQLSAGRNVVVRRGVLGRRTGLVSATGHIIAKHASEANLAARGDVKIAKQLMNSQVWAGGWFIGGAARVIGGSVVATDGVEVAHLGNDADVPTRVVTSVRPEAVKEALELDRRVKRDRERIQAIREQVDAVLRGPMTLTASQKQCAEDVLSKVKRATAGIAEAEQRRQALLENLYSDNPSRVVVSGDIHGRVTIRIRDRETTFHGKSRGPLYIEQRKIKNVTEMVSVNTLSGSIKKLKSERRSPQDLLNDLEMEQDVESGRRP